MDGLELVRRVKRERPQARDADPVRPRSFDHAVAAMRAGADDYLTKPVDPAELVEKARALVALTRERRAAGQDVVLAVGAHPDDVEIGVGGILLRHAAEGHSVTRADAHRRRGGRRRVRARGRVASAPPS